MCVSLPLPTSYFHKNLLMSDPDGKANGRVTARRTTPFMDVMDKTQALCVPPHNLDLGNGITGEAEYPPRGKLNKLRDGSQGKRGYL